ncbi:hypothetical protein KJ359_007213 [Pestalotiopsis sp. 9143b]|nr:hypothetical protein KJ359_007213 [Pestalotiopsis sp. 9143b]
MEMSVMERGLIGEDHHEDGRDDTTTVETASQGLGRTADQQLQLLRPAHEEMVCGTWLDCTKFIPVIKKNEGQDALDMNQDNHLSFMKPPDEEEDCPKCEPQAPTNDGVIASDTAPSAGSAEVSDQTLITAFAPDTPVDETPTTARG